MRTEDLVPLQEVLDRHALERRLDGLKLVAQALEFLAEVMEQTPPGASMTLTSVQQGELRQIILALPLAVAV